MVMAPIASDCRLLEDRPPAVLHRPRALPLRLRQGESIVHVAIVDYHQWQWPQSPAASSPQAGGGPEDSPGGGGPLSPGGPAALEQVAYSCNPC